MLTVNKPIKTYCKASSTLPHFRTTLLPDTFAPSTNSVQKCRAKLSLDTFAPNVVQKCDSVDDALISIQAKSVMQARAGGTTIP